MSALRERLRALKCEALTIWFAARDPRMPWLPRLLALGVAAYAFSPIDLIPDFIPVLGLLDDLVIVPLGIALALKFTPAAVLDDARRKAEVAANKPISRVAALVIALVWIALLAGLAYVLWAAKSSPG
jgi:uncharacterized membrane protein YkvA (DUF1232 family)